MWLVSKNNIPEWIFPRKGKSMNSKFWKDWWVIVLLFGLLAVFAILSLLLPSKDVPSSVGADSNTVQTGQEVNESNKIGIQEPRAAGTDSNTTQVVRDANEPNTVKTESIMAQIRRELGDENIGHLIVPVEWTDRETGL
jgi:hypothetical protein